MTTRTFAVTTMDGETVKLPRNNILYMFNVKGGARFVAARDPRQERIYYFGTEESLPSLTARFKGDFVQVSEPYVEYQEDYERRVKKDREEHRLAMGLLTTRHFGMTTWWPDERDVAERRSDTARAEKKMADREKMQNRRRNILVVRDAIEAVAGSPFIGTHILFKDKTNRTPLPLEHAGLGLSLSRHVGVVREKPEVLAARAGLKLAA